MLKKMSLVVALATLSSGVMAQAKPKVVYGEDNRVDVVDSNNPLFVKLAKSTAAQIKKSKISKNGQKFKLKFESLEDSMDVCSDQKFSQQNSLARCSGFLVGKDLVVTAGHCVQSDFDCSASYWVFDYAAGNIEDNMIDSNNVYSCKKVLRSKLNGRSKKDFAIIQLDRKVKDRAPLKFRKKGEVKVGDELVVIGHPSGLPTKISDGSTVVKNVHSQYFTADLDTFGGNSGSAVFNVTTGKVEGILVRGAKDYVYNSSKGCYEVNECETYGGYNCDGEDVSRIRKVGINSFKGIRGFIKRILGLM